MAREEIIRYLFNNLYQRRSRSLLTILSIFIGITAIFVFVSFGLGLYTYVGEFMTDSTADKLAIMPQGVGPPGIDDTFAFSEEDLEAIENTAGVFEIAGFRVKATEVQQKNKKKFTFIIGLEPDGLNLLEEFSNIGIIEGRALKKRDGGRVLLGYNYMIEDRIFPKAYNLNDKIKIQGEDLRIIGFLEPIGNPQDDSQIYVSDDFFQELYPASKGYSWAIAGVGIENMNGVISKVEKNLRKSRDVEEGKEDFFVQSFQDLMGTYIAVLNGILGFVILIALVSVFVSAINTANTMTTSVLERTKEIGIMKSVGARNSEIFKLFLFESASLGFVAGVIGVLVGWGISSTVGRILGNLGWGFLSPNYPWQLFVGCILFATITGAISGVVPAVRASRINPVETLRYE